MSGAKRAKKKQSLWQTLHAASGSYRRLYGYVKPYKARFIMGLALGLAYGGVNSLFPLAIARVTTTIFHGAPPYPGDHDSAQPLFLRQHLLHAVGEQPGGH